jgi:hypothetical protein
MVTDCFLPKDNFETFLFCYGKLGRHHHEGASGRGGGNIDSNQGGPQEGLSAASEID